MKRSQLVFALLISLVSSVPAFADNGDIDAIKGTVGIVGLGIMGGSIAKNLAAAGWQVIGFDIAKDRCAEAKVRLSASV